MEMNSRLYFKECAGSDRFFRNTALRAVLVFSALAVALFGTCTASGAENGPDAALVRDIEDQLIAPCCWTQPISEHDSAIAEQMRGEVQQMVAAGMSRDAILDRYVSQYGERILVTPRAEGFNRLVYILPWLALFLGAAVLLVLLKKLRAPVSSAPSEPLPDSRFASVIEKELKDLEEQ
jgi:cytochrome c-type biogenesis protein CcmH